MRVLCLVDANPEPPDRWIWNYLSIEAQRDTVDFMYVSTPDLFPKWGKLLTYYPAYCSLALRAQSLVSRNDYDLIVAWESKNGLPLAALRSLRGIEQPKLVIIAFAYKGIAMHFRSLICRIMVGVDHITVPTISEIDHYTRLLGIPRSKITHSPLGWYDLAPIPDANDRRASDYIFAGGRSDRDYGTLLEAVSGLDTQLIINARKFNMSRLNPPSNVRIQDFMPLQEYYALMAESRFVVVPLKATRYAVGLGHIVQAMSARRAIIATRTSSTIEYIENGQTGILVAPYDVQEMRSAISFLATHPEEAKRMGQKARQRYEEHHTFAASAERIYNVMKKVVG